MISVFGLTGFVFVFAMGGAALSLPTLVALTVVSPAPYPTAGVAMMLQPLQAIAGKDDR